MPRDHARVLCRIWADPQFTALSLEAQRMYFLLLSQRLLNHAGVVPLTMNKWANAASGGSAAEVEKWLLELADANFVVFDTRTEELLIRSFIRNDGVAKQPNTLKAALRLAEETESPHLRAVLAKELLKVGTDEARTVAARITPDPDREGQNTLADDGSDGAGHQPSSHRERSTSSLGKVAADRREPIERGSVRRASNPSRALREAIPDSSGDGVGGGDTSRVQDPDEVSSTAGQDDGVRVGPAVRQDADRLCTRLADRIEANGSKRPRVTRRWREAARLLLDRDGRTEEQVSRAIDWCQNDEFWRANILSMPKLRDRYDQLRLAAQRERRDAQAPAEQADRARRNGIPEAWL